MVSREIVAIVQREFVRLDWRGDHGCRHWARVRLHGLVIARRTRASARVVELFAFLHDARRWDEGRDPAHGRRSAELVQELGASALGISDAESALLERACRFHSDGLMADDITVEACWDADRLDLARVGIRPDPDRLCTAAARDLLHAHPDWFQHPSLGATWSRHDRR
jgi:uncharacterized protein